MENKNVEVQKASIDKEVLDVMKSENVLKTLADDKKIKRLILNAFCEELSVLSELSKSVKTLSDTVRVCGAERLKDFFEKVQKNYAEEQKRAVVREKIAQGHKKSKKVAKK